MSKQEIIKGITRSPNFRQQVEGLQELLMTEKKKMIEQFQDPPKLRWVRVTEAVFKWGFLAITGSIGSMIITPRVGQEELFIVFMFIIMFFLNFIFIFLNRIRHEIRKKWAFRFSMFFCLLESSFKRLLLRYNQRYRSEDSKIHDNYQALIRDGYDRGVKHGITIGKEMIEQDFKDEITVYRQQMKRQGDELGRIKARFSGKVEAYCQECPNRRDFGLLLTDTEAMLEPPKPKKKKVKFDL